jgi:hypothetical protein
VKFFLYFFAQSKSYGCRNDTKNNTDLRSGETPAYKNRKFFACGQPNELAAKSRNHFTPGLCPHNMLGYD